MSAVKIVEVGPRDGLQNIRQTVPTATKVELIKRLADTGLSVVEATSFVSPKWIPQLADGTQVLRDLRAILNEKRVNFPVLVPNIKGLRNAVDGGAKEVAVFVSATEGFSRRNTNCSVAESLERVRAVTEEAARLQVPVRGYISCVIACPYDGPTAPSQVLKVVKALIDLGCYEISLGDTIGVGTSADVERLLRPLLEVVPARKLAGHFHDTYGMAIANCIKAYQMGLRTFDSSVAGLGGCPFAQGAKGNLATEDIIYAFQRMGIPTGVDLQKIVSIGVWISETLKIPNSSRAGAAIAAKMISNAPQKSVTTSSPANLGEWKTEQINDEFTLQRRGPDVKIILTRPKNGNALTLSMLRSLNKSVNDIANDSSVFRLIFTARGKYFCTGMDLSSGAGSAKDQYDNLLAFFDAIDNCPQTTIAAINGPCFGGGIGLAFVCDIRLATTTSTFTLTETKLGLSPATISKFVVREWGPAFTRSAMLTAKTISPTELFRIGAIQTICKDQDELEVILEEHLQQLRHVAPKAAAMSKDLVRMAWSSPGGAEQAQTIEKVFDEMNAPGSESEEGKKQFRLKKKNVDWWSLKQGPAKAKL